MTVALRPHSLAAEQSVLGIILLDYKKISSISALKTDHFLHKPHKIIFEAIVNMIFDKKVVDVLTLAEHLKNNNKIEGAGGESYLFELEKNTTSVANISAYAEIVLEKYRQRVILESAQNLEQLKSSDEMIRVLDDTKKSLTYVDIKEKDLLLSFDAIESLNIPTPKLLLPFLEEGSLTLLYGSRGVGKTFFGLNLALSLSSQSAKNFMRWGVINHCAALYIDGEMTLSSMKKRISGMKTEKSDFYLLSHFLFAEHRDQQLDLSNHEVQIYILKMINEHKIKFIVIDNLSCLCPVAENESDEWRQKILPFLLECRRRDVAVLLIHHANKSGNQRGTGAREDVMDNIIKLKNPEGLNYKGCSFSVEFEKCRSYYGDIIVPFSASLINTYGRLEWTTTVS